MAGYETIITGTSPAITALTQLDGVPLFSATTGGITFGVPVSGAGGYATGVRQIVTSFVSAVSSTSTTMPISSSAPTSTQGAQIVTATITPQSATSTLLVYATLLGSTGAVSTVVTAVFRDAATTAFSACYDACLTGTTSLFVSSVGSVVSGSTAPTTFRLRAGPSSATTLTINGHSGTSQSLGVASNTGLVIVEYGA